MAFSRPEDLATLVPTKVRMNQQHSSNSRLTVGHSSYTSFPTCASAMALLMAAEGRVTVSERRSTTGGEGDDEEEEEEEENRRRPRRHAVRRSEGAAGIIEIEFTDGRTMKITLYLEELEKVRERRGTGFPLSEKYLRRPADIFSAQERPRDVVYTYHRYALHNFRKTIYLLCDFTTASPL